MQHIPHLLSMGRFRSIRSAEEEKEQQMQFRAALGTWQAKLHLLLITKK